MNIYKLFSFIFYFSCLTGLENSIVPIVENCEILTNLNKNKYSQNQYEEIKQLLNKKHERIRIASYNILADEMDGKYGLSNYWKTRLPRIVELLMEMQPDILAVQELSDIQLSDLIPFLEGQYEFYGHPRFEDQEYNGFFYRRGRFIATNHEIYSIYDAGKITNTVTKLQLKDKQSQQEFAIFNTHLSFTNPNMRELEIRATLQYIKPIYKKMPVIFTGDFNTFSHRLDLALPFYDGDYIHCILTSEIFSDAADVAMLGHLGPIASYTNDTNEGGIPFRGRGTPGIYLDHIYVSDKVQVLIHAAQPGTVDGFLPSDHMPIFIDCVIKG